MMTPPEEKLLRSLWNRGPLSRAASKTSPDIVRKLLEDRLIEELAPSGRGSITKLALTEQGRAVAAELPPPNPTRLDVLREIAALRSELRELRELVLEVNAHHSFAMRTGQGGDIETVGLASDEAHSGTFSLASFGKRVCETLGELDRQRRCGGLVPLPMLRKELSGLGMSRESFDDAILALEEQYIVDLKVANEPNRLEDREGGIDTPDRGLLYFVVMR